MPDINQLLQTVQADVAAVQSAATNLLTANSTLLNQENAYAAALATFQMIEQGGNQQQIAQAAQMVLMVNATLVCAESVYQNALAAFQAAQTKLAADRQALNVALQALLPPSGG